MRKTIYIVLCLFLMACQSEQPEIKVALHSCAVMPAPRASAAACSLNGKGYIFGGRTQDGTYLNDLWEYTPVTDSWKQITSFPGQARVSAAMIAYNGAIYVGMGFGKGQVYSDSCYLNDWWRWNPELNTWDSLASYPQETTVSPILYVVGSRIYAIYGTSGCFTREINYYDTESDSWHTIKDNYRRALSGFGGVGAQCEGETFYGLGNNTSNLSQWYKMDLESDQWTRLKSAPGKGRTFSACAASEHHIYIFGGRYFGGELTGGEVFSQILRYTPASDRWIYAGDMPCGRGENQIAFGIGNKIYFGLGENENRVLIDKLYCLEE